MFSFKRDKITGYFATHKVTGARCYVMRDPKGRGWFAWRPGQRSLNKRTRAEACANLIG